MSQSEKAVPQPSTPEGCDGKKIKKSKKNIFDSRFFGGGVTFEVVPHHLGIIFMCHTPRFAEKKKSRKQRTPRGGTWRGGLMPQKVKANDTHNEYNT
jgi:hypothetical protein